MNTETLVNRFLRYVAVDTTARHDADRVPSSEGQHILAKMLAEEMQAMGLTEVTVDEHAYVTATLPANTEAAVPTVGFLAHIDTSDAASGADINPRIVNNYGGGDIVLNEQEGVALSPVDFPELSRYKGQDLIVTDGTTLLGADDKAGIAEILTALDCLIAHPEIPHGRIRVAFTPDEEIGHGAELLSLPDFGADFAYTVDGGEVGELCAENFNAAAFTLRIRGRSVHPGRAKNSMINAVLLGCEFVSLLPALDTPAHTEDRQGFIHVDEFRGDVEHAEVKGIIRDHDAAIFATRKETVRRAAEELDRRHGPVTELEIKEQYQNMADMMRGKEYIVDIARDAMEAAGIEPLIVPVRGGTDGARLTVRGLPTPNIFTGGHNFHGRFEYIPVPSMEKAVRVILEIVGRVANLPAA